MHGDASFGRWRQQWRKALDLTQAQLATVPTVVASICKIAVDEHSPSRDVAALLTQWRAQAQDVVEQEAK